MTLPTSIEQAGNIADALNALRARWAQTSSGEASDQVLLQQASEMIAQLRALVSTLDGQLASMRWLAQKQFRPKSEHVPPGQLALDLLGFLMRTKPNAPALTLVPPGPEPTPKPPRDKRKSALHLLPVKQVEKRLDEHERLCGSCGRMQVELGSEPRRHLVYEPANLYFREELLFKYACRTCSDGVVMAQGTPKLIEGSNVSSSLLAHLIVSKVIDAVPIERVGKQLARHGASIASSTLNDWYNRCGEEVLFVQRLVHQDLLRSAMISLDDTPLPIKNAIAPHGMMRGRLWLYLGDVSRVAYCEYSPDWKGTHPQRVLEGFTRPIQNDGYSGLHALFAARDAPVRVGCNDHARRKFVEALRIGDTRAEQVIAIYSALYAVERESKLLTHEERRALRQRRSVPLWTALRNEVDRLSAEREVKSPLGKAVLYFQRQEPRLAAFLDDGILPISNAHVERLLRTVALMRKNSLFIGAPQAGPRYAALLTLALNCLLRGVNPFDYFTQLFDRIAAGWPSSRVLELLPQAPTTDETVE
jgi:transposase